MRLAILLAVALAGVVLYLLRLNRCRHVDDDGRSILMWRKHDDGIKGYCPDCWRETSGWSVDVREPIGTMPKARKATAQEMQRSRWAIAAKRRTAHRMRA